MVKLMQMKTLVTYTRKSVK